VLGAMQETVFYAQEFGRPPGHLRHPPAIARTGAIRHDGSRDHAASNPQHPGYLDNDHVAFVLLNAL
jgi:hypothetical protein